MSDAEPGSTPDSLLSGLLLEQRRRWADGDRLLVEALLQPHPSLRADPDAVLDLLYNEFLLREEAAESIPIEEYCYRFPDLAAPIRLNFAVDQALQPVWQQRSTVARNDGPQQPDTAFPTIPGYEVLAELGRGGMGVVYKARHLQLNRTVALKLLRSAHGGASELLRFRREAEAVARLQHPHIVQVFEIGEWKGEPYIALEYVEGGSLANRLARTPQPPLFAAELVQTLASAIQHAHERGVVHRDLKPANVLLSVVHGPSSVVSGHGPDAGARTQRTTDDGQRTTPKITDFGLAKQTDASALTQSDAIVGTPSYMAPEQALGKGKEATPAVDVYALGAVLYEMLTGRPPFLGETPLDTLGQVVAQEPVPPRRLQPRVPRDLETICLKCLDKEPRRRYPSARELADDLGRFLRDEPIRARPAGSLTHLARWCRRNPALAATSAVAVLALLTVTGLAVAFAASQYQAARDIRNEKDIAEANLKESQKLNASLALDQGLRLCDQGDVPGGLFWLVRGLQACPPEATELDATIRTCLAGWGQNMNGVRPPLRHAGPVSSVAFSPNGKTVLTGSADGTARLWDPVTCQPTGVVLPHEGVVTAATFSPDGKLILTGSADHRARLWDAGTGNLIASLPHPACTHALFRPDGKRILTAGGDKVVRLWDAEARKQIAQTGATTYPIYALALSPDGKHALAGTGDTIAQKGEARLWEAETGKLIAALPHTNAVMSVAFSPDGQLALTGGNDRMARMWATATGQPQGEPIKSAADAIVWAVAFNPDGKSFVSGGDATLAYDVKTREWRWVLYPRNTTKCVTFSPDGRRMVAGCFGGRVQVWNAEVGEPIGVVGAHQQNVDAVAFSPDGNTVVTGSRDGTARLWSLAPTLSVGAPHLRAHASVKALAISPRGSPLLVGTLNGATLLDTQTGKPIGPVLHPEKAVEAVDYHPAGEIILTGGDNQVVQLWNAATGQPIGNPLPHPSRVRGARFTPDGGRILTVCRQPDPARGNAQFWETATGKPIDPPQRLWAVDAFALSADGKSLVAVNPTPPDPNDGPPKNIDKWESSRGEMLLERVVQVPQSEFVAISPDGKYFLTALDGVKGRLWDAAAVRPLSQPLFPHRQPITSGAFSPDGRFVLTGSLDLTARLWTTGGKAVCPPFYFQSYVWAVAFSPDGKTAYAGSTDRTIRRFHVPEPMRGSPGRLALWVEVLTCAEMDAEGVVRELDAEAWNERRERLARSE